MGDISMGKCGYCSRPQPLILKDIQTWKCEYCGTENIVEKDASSDLLENAITACANYEFEEALEYYEEILRENPEHNQAIWGRLCCKYGIVYVEDESGHGALTCHKQVDADIKDDDDYLILRKKRWFLNKPKFREDVKKISRIQNEIRQLKEKNTNNYDIFICYKQSAPEGITTDSFDAEFLYYRLKKEGYRVFFAKKSLKNKAGVQYEAAIFNAISTAKVMIVFGSKPEYFTSTWVKSEWQRYLACVKENTTRKVIIPLYKKMDASQLPEKIRDYQAVDFDMDEKEDFLTLRKRVDELFCANINVQMDQEISVELDEKTKKGILMLADKGVDIRQLDYKNDVAIGELKKSDSGYAAYLLGCICYGQGDNQDARGYFEMACDKGIGEAKEQLDFMKKMEQLKTSKRD